MHAALRDKPEQVHPHAAVEDGAERRVLEERPVLDRLVDPHEVLVEPAPGADRQVADFRVSHLPRRQPGGLAGGHDGRVRERAPQVVEQRRVRERDRVARPRRSTPPAVEDDERYEREAARQIVANESTSRDAPPTSAPSIAGWAQSSSAFSGFTEPP